jgi:hypothetical protein
MKQTNARSEAIHIAQRRDVRRIISRAKARNQAGARFLRRRRGTDQSGEPFSGLAKVAVWQSAAIVAGKDPSLWRQDPCGANIYWHDFGNSRSAWGWEVDHITPVAHGGTDSISNLQALHWKNNQNKADSTSGNYCIVSSDVVEKQSGNAKTLSNISDVPLM